VRKTSTKVVAASSPTWETVEAFARHNVQLLQRVLEEEVDGRTAAAKRFKKVENATAVIWKTLLIAEKTFRRLDAPELLADVASGVVYVNGVRAVNRRTEGVAA